jgi:hypothetical protein
MTDEVPEPEPEPAPPEPAPPAPAALRNDRNRVVWAVAAVAVLLAAALVLQTLRVASKSDELADRTALLTARDAAAGDEQAVRLAASGFVEALLGYDHTDLPGWRDDVLARSGGDFAASFPELFATILEPLYTQLQASAESTVRETFVGQIEGDTATVVVLFDYTTHGPTTGDATAPDIYFSLELGRVDGEWVVVGNPLRISGTAGNSLPGGLAGGDPTATTATTAPPG